VHTGTETSQIGTGRPPARNAPKRLAKTWPTEPPAHPCAHPDSHGFAIPTHPCPHGTRPCAYPIHASAAGISAPSTQCGATGNGAAARVPCNRRNGHVSCNATARVVQRDGMYHSTRRHVSCNATARVIQRDGTCHSTRQHVSFNACAVPCVPRSERRRWCSTHSWRARKGGWRSRSSRAGGGRSVGACRACAVVTRAATVAIAGGERAAVVL
jgi:hypothetical protein